MFYEGVVEGEEGIRNIYGMFIVCYSCFFLNVNGWGDFGCGVFIFWMGESISKE